LVASDAKVTTPKRGSMGTYDFVLERSRHLLAAPIASEKTQVKVQDILGHELK